MSGNDCGEGHGGRLPWVAAAKWIARAGFFLLCAAALVLSLSDPVHLSLVENIWDKLNHAIGYFGLILSSDLGFRTGRRLWEKSVLVFAYGGVLEMLQHILPYREFALADLFANLCGIFLFFAVFILVKHTSMYQAFQNFD